jgi:hypothetical protein
MDISVAIVGYGEGEVTMSVPAWCASMATPVLLTPNLATGHSARLTPNPATDAFAADDLIAKSATLI